MDHSYPAEIERIMERKGYVKRRGTGVSIDALSKSAGVHVDTVKSILEGGRSSRTKTVQKVADALGISASRLSELSGKGGGEVYVGPDVTRHMSQRQRAALTDFLLATLEEKAGGEHADRSAPNTRAAGSAAEDDGKVTPLPHRSREYRPPWEERDAAFEPGEYEEGIDPDQA